MKIPYEDCAKDLKNLAIKAHYLHTKHENEGKVLQAWNSKDYFSEAYANYKSAVDDTSCAHTEFSECINMFIAKYGVTYGVARDMAIGIAGICDIGIETQGQGEEPL